MSHDTMMVDLVTTSHMKSHFDRVLNQVDCSVEINLAYNSTVKGTKTGTRIVAWRRKE